MKRMTSVGTWTTALLVLAACNGGDNGRIHASGHVEATEVRVAGKVGGLVVEAPLREGERVEAGALVARLDTASAEHELARARAELDGAEAQLDLLLSGTRAEDLRRAEEQLAQAREELDAARRDQQRLATLAERGTATRKAADDARTRVEVAQRQVAAIQAEVDKLVAGPRRQEIAAARARRAAALAVVGLVDQRIADATVVAPRAGVVTDRIVEPGEVVMAGAPLVVLTDLDEPWLDVYVDEPNLAAIRLGDAVEVRLDGTSVTYPGRVIRVADVAEFTPKNVQTPEERAKLVFRVKVGLDNRDGTFKPGMPADAYFTPSAGAAAEGGR